MTITLDIWLLVTGAAAGLAGAALARGRSKLLKAAIIGAVTAFLVSLARGLF